MGTTLKTEDDAHVKLCSSPFKTHPLQNAVGSRIKVYSYGEVYSPVITDSLDKANFCATEN